MPPKLKITEKMILDTAFSIVRMEGEEKLTVRRIAEKPGCSTQPVLYHFRSVEEIRSAVYEMADVHHSSFLKEIQEDCDHPLLSIGLHYIRFAVKETELFRFFLMCTDLFSAIMKALSPCAKFLKRRGTAL